MNLPGRALELVYQLYFAISAIPPVGRIDCWGRRKLAVLFNEATSRRDLRMLHALASGRATTRALMPPSEPPSAIQPSVEQCPAIDVIVLNLSAQPALAATLASIDSQAYPPERITKTVVGGADGDIARGDCDIADSVAAALANSKAPLALLISSGLTADPELLNSVATAHRRNDNKVAAWEAYPLLWQKLTFTDPVSLELPVSHLQCAAIRRSALAQTRGADTSFPLAGQGLDLSYSLRAQGFVLRHIGRDLVQPSRHWQRATDADADEVRLAMRRKHGAWPTRLLARYWRKPAVKPAGNQQRGTAAIAAPPVATSRPPGLTPSRLWRQGYELPLGEDMPDMPEVTSSIQTAPLISIIIRSFSGRHHWLRESTLSVLNQTYPCVELVIVEDGSEEHQSFALGLQPQLRQGQSLAYRHQPAWGKSAAGNLGLETASGEYIGFLDDDDLLLPNHLELLYRRIQATPGSLAAYALAFEAQTQPLPGGSYSEEFLSIPRHTRRPYSKAALEQANLFPIQSVLFSRSLYGELGGFDSDRHYLEDWDLWLKYASKTDYLQVPVATSIYRTPADPYERIERVRNPRRRRIET